MEELNERGRFFAFFFRFLYFFLITFGGGNFSLFVLVDLGINLWLGLYVFASGGGSPGSGGSSWAPFH